MVPGARDIAMLLHMKSFVTLQRAHSARSFAKHSLPGLNRIMVERLGIYYRHQVHHVHIKDSLVK